MEGGAVAQGPRLAREHRNVVPRIVDRLTAAEGALMLAHDVPVLADHDAVGIGMHFDRPANGTGRDRVLVVVEADQAGLGHRRRHGVEAIEPAGIGDQPGAFILKHFPDGLLGQLGMAVNLGVGDAAIDQPRVQLVIGLEP